MQVPLIHRQGIPFFYEKSKREFQADKYERYYETVLRQTALHLGDDIWGSYPLQKVLDFGRTYYEKDSLSNITEIGCGVGRWIAHLATLYPEASCWGFDYSYQMLKQANDHWVLGKQVEIDYANKGFAIKVEIQGRKLINLKFGLAKATMLPFADNSQDLLVSSFLLDRLSNPIGGLKEMLRVLKIDGKLIIITPLNFCEAEHWDIFIPLHKLRKQIEELGIVILHWKENMIVEEPLDARGNFVSWKCLALVGVKK